MQVAELAQLTVRYADYATRDSKAESLIPSGLREDESVYTYHFPVYIDQRTAGVSRVDGRISLDVDHRLVRVGLSRHRRDDSHCDRVSQAFRAPEGKHHLPLTQFAVVSQGKSGQFSRFHFEHRQIEFLGDADDPRRNNARSC